MSGKIWLETARFSAPVFGTGIYASLCAVQEKPIASVFYLICAAFLFAFRNIGNENLCRVSASLYAIHTFMLLEAVVLVYDLAFRAIRSNEETWPFAALMVFSAAVTIPFSTAYGVYHLLRDGAALGESVDGSGEDGTIEDDE